jgi:hypothetical protein
MTIHAMIDLETLDTSPSATILTIGGVKFNPYTADEPYDKFYFKLSIDDQDRLGRTVSDSTLEWWAKQDPEIMNEAFDQTDAVGVDEFLNALNKWIVGVDIFWGQGYGFDYTMLENIYRSLGRPIPWNFWQIRDSRTLLGLLKEDPRKKMQQNLHNALEDSRWQAKGVQIAYRDLGLSN